MNDFEWQDFINQFIDTLNKMNDDMNAIRDSMVEFEDDTQEIIGIIDNMYKHVCNKRKD